MAGQGPNQPPGSFALNIERAVEKAKGDIDLVLRRTVLEVFSRVIQKSPVGNPELWAANSEVMNQRAAFTATRAALGKSTSRSTLTKKFPLVEGKGYVGGRFKSNWQVAIGSVPGGTIETNDKGASALAQVQSESLAFGAGKIVYLVNNLSYSKRLEWGYSNQAPYGMVRTTVAEFPGIVRKNATETK